MSTGNRRLFAHLELLFAFSLLPLSINTLLYVFALLTLKRARWLKSRSNNTQIKHLQAQTAKNCK